MILWSIRRQEEALDRLMQEFDKDKATSVTP